MGIGDEIRTRRLGGVRVSAQHVFTNRMPEREAFEGKAAELRERIAAEPDLIHDFTAARRNVLAFYGDGGIGKTSLSRELERLFLAEEGEAARCGVRVDFSEPTSLDPEVLLLQVRAGLTSLGGFPAFDTALAVYWARQNPGTPLAEFVARQSSLGGVATRDRFARDLAEFTQSLVDSAGLAVGGASRAAKFAWRQIQDALVARDLRRNCPFFEQVVTEPDIDQFRLHLPLLLAWDLTRLRGRRPTEVAVFLDTFETVPNQRRSARLGDIEDAVVRMVFFLPNVLFVVTSRRRLDWAVEGRSASLEFAGPDVWPGLLAGTASDQHRVGMLSQPDCEEYLSTCLLDEDGQPLIAPGLRGEIARLSEGMPLYLDVAANHFLALVTRGQEPTPDDFTGGLPQIVMRLMEDLDADQGDLLRAAALLRVFDRGTLRGALPGLRSSAVEQFLDRSFVLHREDNFFSIHELLQTSIRLQDSFTSDPWSPDDWAEVGGRLVAHWSAEFDDPTARIWWDRRTQALAFWQLVGLYATTSTNIPRLADIIMQVQLRGVWATIESARQQPAALLTEHGHALLELLDGMMRRHIGDLADTVTTLEPFARGERPIETNLRRLALYYLGETYDLRGGDAARTFRTIADGHDDRLASEALLSSAHSRSRDGDQLAALEIARQFDPEIDDGELHYRLHELLGHIWWCSGDFATAAHHFLVTLRRAEAQDSPFMIALARRHLCLTQCWDNPTAVLAEVDEAEQLNRDLGMAPGIAQCQMARATALIGQAPLADVDQMLTTAADTFTRSGYLDDAIGPLATAVFAAAAYGQPALAIRRHTDLMQRAQGRRVRHWLAAADIWALGAPEAEHPVTWATGPRTGAAAWARPLRDRLLR
jgi:hypothetical protein